jgi:hypothetical protein
MYVMTVVKLEKRGARNTHTLRISIVMFRKCRAWYSIAEVTIKPKGNRKKIIIFGSLLKEMKNIAKLKFSLKMMRIN